MPLAMFKGLLPQSRPAVEVDEGGDGDESVEDDLIPVVAPHKIHLI